VFVCKTCLLAFAVSFCLSVYVRFFCAFVHSADGPEVLYFWVVVDLLSGSVAEWLACWTQAQKGPGSNRSRDALG